jgi:ribose transport system permease protein
MRRRRRPGERLLVGYLRLRAFLTTLVTLIIVRAIVDMLLLKYSVAIAAAFPSIPRSGTIFGEGFVFGVPFSVVVTLALAIAMHLVLSRTRARLARSRRRRLAPLGHNVGIPVRRVICGDLCRVRHAGRAGRRALRLAAGRRNADTGIGLEIAALTAAVLGGNSLGGGRGSAAKAIIGAITVMIMVNSLVQMGVTSGTNSLALGMVLLFAVAIDVRWLKNRLQASCPRSMSRRPISACRPAWHRGSGLALCAERPAGPVARSASIASTGRRTSSSTRTTTSMSATAPATSCASSPPTTKSRRSSPMSAAGRSAWPSPGTARCWSASAAWASIRVGRDREISKLTDETNRSWFSVIDDSRLRLADDLDIAPDGRVFFSEATIRYEMHEWPVDCLESRGNGRIICYDPNTGIDAHGPEEPRLPERHLHDA